MLPVRKLAGLFGIRSAAERMQNRKLRRKPVTFQVTCTVDNTEFPAEVLELGPVGMRVRLRRHVGAGRIVGVRYDTKEFYSETINMGIVWCARAHGHIEAGLLFVSSPDKVAASWVGEFLKLLGLVGTAAVDHRRQVRQPTQLGGRLRVQGQDVQVSGTVLDLSTGGALFETSAEPEPGTPITLQVGPYRRLPAVSCSGQVVRGHRSSRGSTWLCGIRFEPPPSGVRPYLAS